MKITIEIPDVVASHLDPSRFQEVVQGVIADQVRSRLVDDAISSIDKQVQDLPIEDVKVSA